jgi:hypothetical protein
MATGKNASPGSTHELIELIAESDDTPLRSIDWRTGRGVPRHPFGRPAAAFYPGVPLAETGCRCWVRLMDDAKYGSSPVDWNGVRTTAGGKEVTPTPPAHSR